MPSGDAWLDGSLIGMMTNARAASQMGEAGQSTCQDVVSYSEAASYSAGSIGHPNLCARPCSFFAKGHCRYGRRCNQCHERHEQLQSLPNKKQRAYLRDLNEAQIWRLLWPYLRAQVETWELSAGDPRPVIELAHQRFKHLVRSGANSVVPCRVAHELSGVLRSMNFSGLMDIALGRLNPCPECSRPSAARLWLDGAEVVK